MNGRRAVRMAGGAGIQITAYEDHNKSAQCFSVYPKLKGILKPGILFDHPGIHIFVSEFLVLCQYVT